MFIEAGQALNYFYPRPPRGGRQTAKAMRQEIKAFLSTPSARRATKRLQSIETGEENFYPRPPRGGRLFATRSLCFSFAYFYPRPPRGGRQKIIITSSFLFEFLSTPSARRATINVIRLAQIECISIHALREEGDNHSKSFLSVRLYFYPRPPRGGRPAVSSRAFCWWGYFYPRPPRGGRRRKVYAQVPTEDISIHALREEGDGAVRVHLPRLQDFYPRPPRGGRRWRSLPRPESRSISIHALREEGDEDCKPTWTTLENFYPRPPRGGRQYYRTNGIADIEFLSTPSARRATSKLWAGKKPTRISIHALREEGDRPKTTGALSPLNFYPRPPRGGRLLAIFQAKTGRNISIHALREEGDCVVKGVNWGEFHFYPRPPRGGRLPEIINEEEQLDISIHALREEGDRKYQS